MFATSHPTLPPPVTRAAPSHVSDRRAELDWLRGLMLVLMTLTHLPTTLSPRLSQPFGFVSAAEGFVFLSAFLVGSVYVRMAQRRGWPAMQRALAGRAFKVYAAHVALLLFLFLVLVPLATRGGGGAIADLASFYVAHPAQALVSGLALFYAPPLLDILPMYVVFLALSPWLLAHGQRRGWTVLLAGSAGLWVVAQAGGGRLAYEALAAALGLVQPYRETGAFSLLAWQALWVAGLWAGAAPATAPAAVGARPAWWTRAGVVRVAIAVAVVCMAWRHLVGQAPFGSLVHLNMLFDKWTLGPLRLVNFAALVLVVIHAQDVLRRWVEGSRLVTLGRASLTVFCAHLVLCLVLLTVVGNAGPGAPGLVDVLLTAGSLAILYAVAREVTLRDAGDAEPKMPEGRASGVPEVLRVRSMRRARPRGARAVNPAPRMAR